MNDVISRNKMFVKFPSCVILYSILYTQFFLSCLSKKEVRVLLLDSEEKRNFLYMMNFEKTFVSLCHFKRDTLQSISIRGTQEVNHGFKVALFLFFESRKYPLRHHTYSTD